MEVYQFFVYKVEQFKKNQRWQNSLHAKFHVSTGAEVAEDHAYEHFQVGNYFKLQYLIFSLLANWSGILILNVKSVTAV